MRFASELELAAFRERGLMHVSAQHQLRAGVGECPQHAVAVPDRLLPLGGPRRLSEMVVERDDPVRVVRRLLQPRGDHFELALAQRPALLPPGAHRVQADDDE